MANIDETIITDANLPLRWKCPHCGAVSRLDEEADEILIRHFKLIRQCGRCGHPAYMDITAYRGLQKKVVEYLLNGATNRL